MATPKEVRDALLAVVRRVTTANGYTTDMPSENVFAAYTANLIAMGPDDAYPKAFVLIDKGSYTEQPSGLKAMELHFIVIFVFKTKDTGPSAQEQAETAIVDFERALQLDDRLGDTVDTAQVAEFLTDGGTCAPEGVASFAVKTERKSA